MIETDDIVRECIWDEGGSDVKILTWERDPSNGQWQSWSRVYSVSYDLRALSTRGGSEFYILGRAKNGDDVIEAWELTTLKGGWEPVRPRALLDQPASPTSSIVQLKGPFFILPPNREGEPTLVRRELYRGAQYGVRAMGVDPDGRVIYFLGDTLPGLYAIDLQAEGDPQAAITPSQWPEIVTADDVYAHQHSVLGRTWWVEHGASPEYLDLRSLLFDPDNDGLIDSWESYTYLDFMTLYPGDDWDWTIHDWWPR